MIKLGFSVNFNKYGNVIFVNRCCNVDLPLGMCNKCKFVDWCKDIQNRIVDNAFVYHGENYDDSYPVIKVNFDFELDENGNIIEPIYKSCNKVGYCYGCKFTNWCQRVVNLIRRG